MEPHTRFISSSSRAREMVVPQSTKTAANAKLAAFVRQFTTVRRE
jgi:hypothetical protein